MKYGHIIMVVFILGLLAGCSTNNNGGDAFKSVDTVKASGEAPKNIMGNLNGTNSTNSTGDYSGNQTGNYTGNNTFLNTSNLNLSETLNISNTSIR